MRSKVRKSVWMRAGGRCEYCGLHDDDSLIGHQVEHIIPRTHGGSDDLDNLALACIACNLFKGTNVAAFDDDGATLSPLFHPRRENWSDHFVMQGFEILGLTPVGRVTVVVLRLNDAVHMRLRIAAEL